jgi:hypothetical protein
MSEMTIHKGECFEGVGKVIRSRVVNYADADITQASVTAITYIFNQYPDADDAEADANATPVQIEVTAGTVSSLVFNTLQTWPDDENGYNFAMTLPAASFPVGGKFYRVEVWIDPTIGEDFLAGIWILECHATARD